MVNHREIILRLAEMLVDAEIVYFGTPDEGAAHNASLDEVSAVKEAFDAMVQAYALSKTFGGSVTHHLRKRFDGVTRRTALRAKEIVMGLCDDTLSHEPNIPTSL